MFVCMTQGCWQGWVCKQASNIMSLQWVMQVPPGAAQQVVFAMLSTLLATDDSFASHQLTGAGSAAVL